MGQVEITRLNIPHKEPEVVMVVTLTEDTFKTLQAERLRAVMREAAFAMDDKPGATMHYTWYLNEYAERMYSKMNPEMPEPCAPGIILPLKNLNILHVYTANGLPQDVIDADCFQSVRPFQREDMSPDNRRARNYSINVSECYNINEVANWLAKKLNYIIRED